MARSPGDAMQVGVGTAIWLAPSVRAAADIRARLAAAGRPLLAPNVVTFDSFATAIIDHARDPRPPEPSPRMAVESVAKHLIRDGKLDYFRRVVDTRGFISGAAGLIEELGAGDVSPEQFASADARSAKLAACSELYSAVVRHLGGSASPLARATDLLRDRMPGPFAAVEHAFVEGFTSFREIEWRLLEALARIVAVSVALPDAEDEREEAFATLRATRERLANVLRGSRSSWTALPTTKDTGRPGGLDHVQQHLFRKSAPQAADSDGVATIEAPGELGEARLVARRIRTLLATGVRPADVIVTTRDLEYSRALLDEVFAEYGLPVEIDGDVPLARNPAVATLVRAVNIAPGGFPFAAVTALLRSTYFRPDWPEADPETVRRAEGLLRLLGVARDRDAYLHAVRLWSETPPEGLEDEGADEPRRLRKARTAAHCRPFLERFFQAWNGLPAHAEPGVFTNWVREFARNIGLVGAAESDATDSQPLRTLFSLLDRETGEPTSWAAYSRLLMVVASTDSLPRTSATAGRIRVVPPEQARHLACDYLFVLGLGENSFPRAGPPTSLLDDADRIALRAAGLPLPDPAARLGDEQFLFLRLVGRPRRGLVLSYPATDEKGQPLLPGSFLRAVVDCFAPGALKPEHQRMLIEGYTSRPALSAAEARVQLAGRMRDSEPTTKWQHPALSSELCEHLRRANDVAVARFRSPDYGAFDGTLESSPALAEVRERFGPEKVFSPTALEAYVACPFRFLLEHVLRLEELEEPSDEVEQTRRGAAYHRALSRLHTKLNADPDLIRSRLPDRIDKDLLDEIDTAVKEYADRAPSPAAKKLWELEGKRLHRSAAKYRDHWDGFLDPWREKEAFLSPQLLEADFGFTASGRQVQSAAAGAEIAPLIIQVGGVEVRVGGRIDRVDVADLRGELGFWIIDYKTGRSANYTGKSLSRLESLQLSLYALAVERVFFPGRAARPLGLAYWLVTEDGPKPVLPDKRSLLTWLGDPKRWAKFREQLEEWVAQIVSRIRDGRFPLSPRSDHCTDTCHFGPVCRISQSRNVGKTWDLALPGDRAE